MKLKTVFFTLLISGSATIVAQDGASLFKQNCSACHSVGKGKLVGPDLAGIADRRSEEWIVSFVKNAQAFGETDADAKTIINEYGYPMPNQNVNDTEIKAIVTYITENSPKVSDEAVTEEITTEIVPEANPALDPANASAEDIAFGVQLFDGSKPLENGGVSCISCHNVNHRDLIAGGLLAKDLTKVYERLGGAGLNGILSAPPFPAMASSYQNHPLTEKEIFQLSAFFYDAATNQIYQPQRTYNTHLLLYGGGVAFIIIIGIILLMFIERKRKCVKEDIYKRQIKAATSKNIY